MAAVVRSVVSRASRLASALVDAACLVSLSLAFVVGTYGLIDSRMLTADAESTVWTPYKPVEPDFLSFSDLRRENPDVVGWLDVYGTGIDYPVCQADTLSYYLDHNAKREHALSGSVFLEPDADASLSGPVTFLFAHHMAGHVMFGDLDLFLDPGFMETHRYGNVFDGERNLGLEFVCCLSCDAYDDAVYGRVPEGGMEAWLTEMRGRVVSSADVAVSSSDRLVALSTCATDSTNGRTVVIAALRDETFENPFVEWPNTGDGVDAPDLSWRDKMMAAAAVCGIIAVADEWKWGWICRLRTRLSGRR